MLDPAHSKKMKLDAMLTPSRGAKGFVCPHCNHLSTQNWTSLFYTDGLALPDKLKIGQREGFAAHCQGCGEPSIWLENELLFPQSSTAPMPVADMPEEVKIDYLEARAVFDKSARAAGGLLRIAFEKLLPYLDVKNRKPNDAIKELVAKGMVMETEQQALDVMRVFANQAVHVGFVKLEDQPGTVSFLFWLLNDIVRQLITRRNQIHTAFAGLPKDKLDEIAKRDAKK